MYNKALVSDILDVLSHHYFDINAKTVYALCQKHTKNLEDTLKEIQKRLKKK